MKKRFLTKRMYGATIAAPLSRREDDRKKISDPNHPS